MADITTRGRISEEFLNFSNCIFEIFFVLHFLIIGKIFEAEGGGGNFLRKI